MTHSTSVEGMIHAILLNDIEKTVVAVRPEHEYHLAGVAHLILMLDFRLLITLPDFIINSFEQS
jgi:hypothetical protein